MATQAPIPPAPPDWTAAVSWAVAAGAREADVLGAWRLDRAVPVPIGGLWHVVRVTRATGLDALERLRRRGEPVGAVLEVPARDVLEYLVPRGVTAAWPELPRTRAVGHGVIRCPAPHLTQASGRGALCGRRWLVPLPALTDSDALCECVAAALASRTTRERRFPRQRRSVRDAREFVIGTLAGWGYDQVPDSLRLCVSEVVTNALLHGVPPGRLFAVRVTADGAMIRVEVRDSGDGVPTPRNPGPCEETGRGLALVAAVADDWGVVRHAVGKTVWVAVTT